MAKQENIEPKLKQRTLYYQPLAFGMKIARHVAVHLSDSESERGIN